MEERARERQENERKRILRENLQSAFGDSETM